MSKPSEGSFGKPKRNIWKIIVPIVVVVVLVPLLMYAYGYFALGNTYSKCWETISVSEFDETMLDDIVSGRVTEYNDEYTMHNPTGMDIRFVRLNIDCWVDGNKFATTQESDIYLPAGGSVKIPCTNYCDSAVNDIILGPYYEMTHCVEAIVSTNVLFIPITRGFTYVNSETIWR